MSSDRIIFSLALLEGFHLARIVDEFRELVEDRDATDPALRRLTPSAYPDDLDAANAFAESTRGDLLDRRAADAASVREALAPFAVDIDSLSEEDALASRDLVIATDDLEAWLRTLTAIRLVIADRLGITAEDQSTGDGRADIYEWLGYRLEVLIQAADQADASRDR
jgi:hypothetical protein